MNVYVINMDRDRERMQTVGSQLERLGVQYSRFAAVDAKRLKQSELRRAVNRFRWWCAVGRPVRIGEIGCAMSHYAIYRQMQQNHMEVACVLEDDVILDGRFNEVLEFAERNIDITRPQVFLLSNHTGVVDDNEACHVVACKKGMYAEGYVITALAAKALCVANSPMQTPCDWWGHWARRGVIQLYHVFPTICSQDQTRYKSGTVDLNCFKVSELGSFRWLLHKMMRLIGKGLDMVLSLC